MEVRLFTMLLSQPPKRNVPADELIIDALLGCCLFVGPFFGAFALFALPASDGGPGRFLFGYGGLAAISLSYLVLGNLRGESEGNLWLKALCICGASSSMGLNASRLSFVFALLTFPFTAIGIWLRRRGFALWRMSGRSS